jgi:hypothetical protein
MKQFLVMMAASSFSKKGFAKIGKQAMAYRGKVLKVWGYVDGGNVLPKDSDHNHHHPRTWSFKLNLTTKWVSLFPSSFPWTMGTIN